MADDDINNLDGRLSSRQEPLEVTFGEHESESGPD